MRTYPRLLTFAALAGAVAFGTACEDDLDPREEANDRLQGDWEVESFTVDGSERMTFSISSFEMEFDKEDPFEGETEWTLIATNGGSTKIEGDYEIKDNGNEIDIDGDDFDIDIDGDDLELQGIVDQETWIIRAERD